MKKLLIILFISSFTLCFSQHYKIVGIIDGDTVKALDEEKKELIRVRLAEIDCPEKGQPFGSKATQFTAAAIFQKKVLIKIIDHDQYGRSIGKIYYDKNKYLSEELVRVGLAIVYRKYSKNPQLLFLENQARKQKLGLWSDPHFMKPSEFRNNEKNKN